MGWRMASQSKDRISKQIATVSSKIESTPGTVIAAASGGVSVSGAGPSALADAAQIAYAVLLLCVLCPLEL
jgi:hypothetical protein